MLPEHTNTLYEKEAISSISLTKEVAAKINELVDAYNAFSAIDLEWKQTQEGTIRKGVVYMKDHLINALNDLMNLLLRSGYIDDRLREQTALLSARLDSLVGKNLSDDAEIMDARTGFDNVAYETIGSSIRAQITKVVKAITMDNMELIAGIISPGSIQSDGTTVASTHVTWCSDFIPYSGELLYVDFNEDANIQYFLYDENKQFIKNVTDLTKSKGFIRVKHTHVQDAPETAYLRFNVKLDSGATITPGSVNITMLRMLNENHFSVTHESIFQNLHSVSLNSLNLFGEGIGNEGETSASGIRQATHSFIDCGINASVFVKTKPGYQMRGYYYHADGTFAEKVEGGLMDGGVSFVTKYPRIKIVFSKKDNSPITNAEVLENCEIIVTRADYSTVFNPTSIANAHLLSEAEDKMAHCSSIVTNDNNLYVGYYADKENNVEGITNPTVKLMLCVTDKFTQRQQNIEMCKLGDTFTGLKQVTYAPYDPTMWSMDGSVRMYFSACDETDGVLLGFLNYPKTEVFTRCTISHAGDNYLMNVGGMRALYGDLGFTTFDNFRLIHVSDFINYEGAIYTTLCMDNSSPALLLKTSDGITFEIVHVFDDGEHHREINGVIRNGVFTYIFRGTSGVYMNSYDIANDTQGEKKYIVNASSKPMAFSTFFNDYFILNTSGNRRCATLYRVENGELVQLHGFYDTHTFHYASCLYHNDYCYISFTTDEGKVSSTQDRANIKLLKFLIY